MSRTSNIDTTLSLHTHKPTSRLLAISTPKQGKIFLLSTCLVVILPIMNAISVLCIIHEHYRRLWIAPASMFCLIIVLHPAHTRSHIALRSYPPAVPWCNLCKQKVKALSSCDIHFTADFLTMATDKGDWEIKHGSSWELITFCG